MTVAAFYLQVNNSEKLSVTTKYYSPQTTYIVFVNHLYNMRQLLFLFSMSIAGCMPAPKPLDVKDPKALPPITLFMADTVTKYNTDSLPKGRPTLLVFYGRNCPYCDTMTENIVQHIDTLKDVNIVTLSAGEFHYVDVYNKKFELSKYSNIKNGLDYNNVLFTFYGAQGLPFIVFYDQNRQIKRANLGTLSVDSIRYIIDKALVSSMVADKKPV